MKLSLGRGLVFFIMGLPIGFILSALAFAILGRSIVAPELAPYALIFAAIAGIATAVGKPAP